MKSLPPNTSMEEVDDKMAINLISLPKTIGKWGDNDDEIKINVSPAQKNTPILIGHGKDDDIVSADSSKLAYKLLKKQCNNVELHIYNGRHKISIDFLKKIRELIVNKEAINI